MGIEDLIYLALVLEDTYFLKSRRANPDHVVCVAISFKKLETWVFDNIGKPQTCSQSNHLSSIPVLPLPLPTDLLIRNEAKDRQKKVKFLFPAKTLTPNCKYPKVCKCNLQTSKLKNVGKTEN